MMPVAVRRLSHGLMAVLVVAGVGSGFLISGSSARADTTVSEGLNPSGVAVNRAGDVFIADTDKNRVVVDKPNGSGGYTESLVDRHRPLIPSKCGGRHLWGCVHRWAACNGGVVVDKPNGSGGYIQSVLADSALINPAGGGGRHGRGCVYRRRSQRRGRVVVDKPNGSGGYTQSVVDDTGLSYPEGVAVDASGDVFIADTGNSGVVVDKPNGSGGYTQSVVDDSGLLDPRGVAVDAAGDVFIADTRNDRVVVDKPNGSGGYTESVVVAETGIYYPTAVAVDSVGGRVHRQTPASERVVVDKPNGSGGYTQSVGR